MFDFSVFTSWLDAALLSVMPGWLTILVECVLVALGIITLYAIFAMVMIYVERKFCAFVQCRLGPDRVGPWGTIQVVCDVLKMLTKEIVSLRKTDRFLHALAPFLVVTASMTTFACLPWNKGAQIISYELSIGMVMLTMICLAGTMSFSELCQNQAEGGWYIFRGHFVALAAFIVYLIAGNAECNRGPFDLPESESELTAGYHTEYSGMDFGYYYLAEYLNLFICAGMASTVFLGGWAPFVIPGLDGFNEVMAMIPGFVWFLAKVFFVLFLLLWERWTFPRLRIDQILTLEWKYLIPISMPLLVLMALCVSLGLTF